MKKSLIYNADVYRGHFQTVRWQILQPFNSKLILPPPRMFPPVMNDVKILGSKNYNHELATSHYQDRVLSPFEQFLKSMQTNGGCTSNTVDMLEGCRKEVKILGKKLGTGIITTTEEGNVVKVVDDKNKFVSNFLSATINIILYVCHNFPRCCDCFDNNLQLIFHPPKFFAIKASTNLW